MRASRSQVRWCAPNRVNFTPTDVWRRDRIVVQSHSPHAGVRDYTGYLYVQAPTGTVLTLTLADHLANTTLASTTITTTAAAGAWGRVSFTFASTSAGTTCAPLVAGSDPSVNCGNLPNADHACIRCGGQFGIQVPAGVTVHVGYGFLQAGAWGTFRGLPVKQSVVDLMNLMGVKAIRQGGTISQKFRCVRIRTQSVATCRRKSQLCSRAPPKPTSVAVVPSFAAGRTGLGRLPCVHPSVSRGTLRSCLDGVRSRFVDGRATPMFTRA